MNSLAVSAAQDPSGPALPATRISLLGLSSVRSRLGVRSPALADRLDELARTVILRHLSPGDVFEPDGEGAYVVLFTDVSELEAEAKCQAISSEIAQRFLTADPSGAPGVEAVLAQLPRSAMTEGRAHAALLQAFADGDGIVAWSSPPVSPPASEPSPGRLPAYAGADQDRWPIEVRSPRRDRYPEWGVVPPAGRPASEGQPQPGRSGASERPRYQPLWDFETRSLVRFRLERPAPADTGDAGHFAHDLASLCEALARLLHLFGTRRRLAVVWPVAEASLAAPAHQDGLLAALRNVSREVRALLTVELSVASGPIAPSTGHFARRLAELEVTLWACASLGEGTGLPDLHGLKAAAVQIAPGVPEADSIAMLSGFAGRARQARLLPAAHGLGTRSLVLGAMAAGVRFISGAAVHQAVASPRQGLRFEPLDLYRAQGAG